MTLDREPMTHGATDTCGTRAHAAAGISRGHPDVHAPPDGGPGQRSGLARRQCSEFLTTTRAALGRARDGDRGAFARAPRTSTTSSRSSPDATYVDLETGREVRFPEELRSWILGDVEIFPTDLARTSAAIAAFTRAVTASGAFP